jgi:hypothetical protein
MSADGDPPGTLTFFFFLGSRPCLSRPLPSGTTYYYEGQFAQEGFDVGDEADRRDRHLTEGNSGAPRQPV